MSLRSDLSVVIRKLLPQRHIQLTTKRYRVKKKWASNLKTKDATELALEHFDLHYSPVYGHLWPSIRIALLSQQKYCALVNNFHSSPVECSRKLRDNGAYNFLRKINKAVDDLTNEFQSFTSSSGAAMSTKCYPEYSFADAELGEEANHRAVFESNHVRETTLDEEFSENSLHVSEHSLNSFSEFIPAQKVFSEKQLLREKEISMNIYEPHDIKASIVLDEDRGSSAEMLRVFVYPQGDTTDFPTPKADKSGTLEYYLMDAASVLPVVALNPNPSDKILDMCSAPGGKTLTLLQTFMPGEIVANDISWSRLQRLGTVLKWYCPQTIDRVKRTQRDARTFNSPLFDKVLVDVPCSTDRHVLIAAENNLFKPIRIRERLEIPTLQRQLLLAGIKSVKPGGSVVYSTCSLSPVQNDGVIQAVIEDLWNTTRIDVNVTDISWIQGTFGNTFRFYNGCRFGQLVLPTLRANFGPMYFCKLKRLD